jgi:hypothetical protein
MSRLKVALDAAVSISIVIAAMAICYVAYRQYSAPRRPERPSVPSPGARIKLPGVNWVDARRNLIVVIKPGCPYCDESMPFYRKALESGTPGQLRVLLVGPASRESLRDYLSQRGIAADPVRVQIRSLFVSATPTIILVDSTGRVEKTWVGLLSASRQCEVLAAVDVRCPVAP